MASLAIFISVICLLAVASCEPAISFPLNSQLPPVARIDEPFSYTISPYTFRSDSKLSYSLGDAPSWLSIDSSDGRLYGTPQDNDVPSGEVVGQTVEIIADDGTGTSTLNATLVISRYQAPSIKIPLSEQISRFGDYSAPSSLLSYPSTQFTYTFDSNTFEYKPDMINFYAISADSSPLPAWIKFDAPSLTFSGETPPAESLIQPPQTFDFRLVASDIVGFSAVHVAFSIVVGSHKLSTDNPIITLNATVGESLSYEGLSESIKLDNETPKPGDVEISTDGMPKWLTLDEDSWKIEGTPKQGDRSTNFTVNFHDIYADSLDVLFVINVATGLFRKTLDDITIRAGREIDVDLTPYFWDPSDITAELSAKPEKDWLSLNDLKLNGRVPRSASGNFEITIKASSKSSGIEETQSFGVRLLAAIPTLASTSQTSASQTATETASETSQPSETSSSAGDEVPKRDSSGLSTSEILLATILPILFVALLIMLLICCCIRRRRARRTYLSGKFRNKISAPVLGSLRVNGNNSRMGQVHQVYAFGGPDERLDRQGYREMDSQPSTTLSPSIGSLATPDLPAGFISDDSREQVGRTMSMPVTDGGRQSWVTVADTMTPNGHRSEVTLLSPQSDITIPESTHQLIPPPAFLSDSGGNSFRSGLDLTIPSLDDLSSLQRGNTQTVSDPFSLEPNSSSLAFSSSHQSSPRLMTGLFGKKTLVTGSRNGPRPKDNAPLLPEIDESIRELQQPSPARLSHQQQFSQSNSRAWYDTDSSSAGRSLRTDPSFGTSENWRVIAGSHRNVASMSYHELVDAAPFHPNRPGSTVSMGREGALPGERTGSDLISPSQWGDARTSIRGSMSSRIFSRSNSRYSRLGESTSGAWRREDSGRGSLKAFL